MHRPIGRYLTSLKPVVSQGCKKGFRFFIGFSGFLKVSLYEDQTRKYDPKAREKHPTPGTPCLTKDKSPVSEGEEHYVKNKDEIDESHTSQLKFEHEVYLLNYTK